MTPHAEDKLMRRAVITGWGSCVPDAVLSNSDLENRLDTSDDWITTRTGIKERRIADATTGEIATVAARHALAAAGLDGSDIDMVIVATCTPDRLIPAVATVVQKEIGAIGASAFDVNAACAGFAYGAAVGTSAIESGLGKRVLVIGADRLSAWLDFEDRSTAVLFGDGAGAVVLEASDDVGSAAPGVLSVDIGANGDFGEQLTVPGSGLEVHPPDKMVAITMDGREVFRQAVVVMGEIAAKVTEAAGLELNEIDLLIPHQANSRIIDATARRLDLDPRRVFVNIHAYGNTSSASIPIALTEALEQGRIEPGAHIVFVAFGGGFSWGALAVRWGDRVHPLGKSDAALPPSNRTALEIMESNQV